MKKTILAVALTAATLGVSTGAMALTFTDGDFDGTINIGGDITPPVSTNYWQWAAGDAISISSQHTEMTNDYKTLTYPAASNLTLLVGQTKQATWGDAIGPISPQITYQDAAGNTITPVWSTTGNTGKGTMTLPVTAEDGSTPLGSMTMDVQVASATLLVSPANHPDTQLASNYFEVSGLYVNMYGPNALPTSSSAVMSTGNLAMSWLNTLGVTKTVTDFLNDLGTVTGQTYTSPGTDGIHPANPFTNPSYAYTGAYGLGIAQGDNIVVNFTNPVTVSTTWKAPLKISVTYI